MICLAGQSNKHGLSYDNEADAEATDVDFSLQTFGLIKKTQELATLQCEDLTTGALISRHIENADKS